MRPGLDRGAQVRPERVSGLAEIRGACLDQPIRACIDAHTRASLFSSSFIIFFYNFRKRRGARTNASPQGGIPGFRTNDSPSGVIPALNTSLWGVIRSPNYSRGGVIQEPGFRQPTFRLFRRLFG